MFLVEILLPLHDNEGRPFASAMFAAVRQQLSSRFGGITSFMRTPAQGTFESGGGVQHDEIVIMEIMTDQLDRDWWAAYRKQLEIDFMQDEIVIRASIMEKL